MMMRYHYKSPNKIPLIPIALVLGLFLVTQLLFDPFSHVVEPILVTAQGVQEAVEEVVDYASASKRSLWVENNLLRKQIAELRSENIQYERKLLLERGRKTEENLFPDGFPLERVAGTTYPFDNHLVFTSASEVSEGDIVTLHGVYMGNVVRVAGSLVYAIQPKTGEKILAYVPGVGEVEVEVLRNFSYQLTLPLESIIPPAVFLAKNPRVVLGEVVQTREIESANQLILSITSPVNPAAFTEFSLVHVL